MKLIMTFLFFTPLFSHAGEIAGGTYNLKGVVFTEWTDWRCEPTGWKKVKFIREQKPQTRPLKIQDMGWALSSPEGGLLKVHTEKNGCTFLYGENRSSRRTNTVFIPYSQGTPAPCQVSSNRMITLSIKHHFDEPFGSCDRNQTFRSGTFQFRYGYELDAEGRVLWNPQPIEYVSP